MKASPWWTCSDTAVTTLDHRYVSLTLTFLTLRLLAVYSGNKLSGIRDTRLYCKVKRNDRVGSSWEFITDPYETRKSPTFERFSRDGKSITVLTFNV